VVKKKKIQRISKVRRRRGKKGCGKEEGTALRNDEPKQADVTVKTSNATPKKGSSPFCRLKGSTRKRKGVEKIER